MRGALGEGDGLGDERSVRFEELYAAHLAHITGYVRRRTADPDDADRELLGLATWEELDNGQIATVLGVSRNAVRIRLHRARRRFAKELQRHGAGHHLATHAFAPRSKGEPA
jgi:DNA-directed RNA polymerase specialized sigma24 family protein